MKRTQLLFITMALVFILLGCASRKAPVAESMEKPSLEGIAPVREKLSWEVEWERMLKEAKKEGRVIMITGMDPDTTSSISKAVKEKFGLEVLSIIARGPEIGIKVATELRAGIRSFDVFMDGAGTGTKTLKPLGAFVPMKPFLLLPEVLDTKGWFGNQLPWVEKDEMLFQFQSYASVSDAINTNLVEKGEIMAYRDLLNPKWKGKILLDDPTLPGPLRWSLFIGEYFSELGWAFQKELARQEPTLLRDRRMMAEWLARSKYSVYIGTQTETLRMKQAGAPVDFIYPVDGTYASSGHGNLALFNKAPHPRAAQVFVNWVLSREGQDIISRVRMKQSSRTDVPIDHLSPEETREYVLKAGVTFIIFNQEEYMELEEKRSIKIKEIWGPLTGR